MDKMRWWIITLIISVSMVSSAYVWAFEFHGFTEVGLGPRFGDKRIKKDNYNLLEGRFQLKYSYFPSSGLLLKKNFEFFFKGELLADAYDEDVKLMAREAYIILSPVSSIDLKVGRQILTWGTGDLVFINDLFPKDFVSFFIGRDEEYLKLPSDAIKGSLFTKLASLDLVIIPFFEPDNPITGNRLSFFDSFEGRIVGEESERRIVEPVDSLDDN